MSATYYPLRYAKPLMPNCMRYHIANFYDLKAAVRALEALQVEDNAEVRFADVPTGEHYDSDPTQEEIVASGPLTSVSLERGTRAEVVLR